jgi:hypothetical protein
LDFFSTPGPPAVGRGRYNKGYHMICGTNFSLIISIVALFVSTSALLTNYFNFRRKMKTKVSGLYVLSSSAECNDQFVYQIFLENNKDKAVTVFGIYLKIYPNYYIEIEDFESNPLIIKPYETYSKKYGPILYYGINLNKIEMNHLFERDGKRLRHKRRIILATSEGKYTVRNDIKHWIPVMDVFKNHYTAWVKPYSVKFKDRYIGSNIKYIVLLKYEDTEQTILLKENDYQIWVFRNFVLTRESLEDKNKLNVFLQLMKDSGKLPCDSFEIIEPGIQNEEMSKTINAPVINNFQYYILGKITTFLSDRKMKRNNNELKKKAGKKN